MKEEERDRAMFLTLCAACVRQFYNSSEYSVHRENLNQTVKEPCVYCSYKHGWDYKITRKKGGLRKVLIDGQLMKKAPRSSAGFIR